MKSVFFTLCAVSILLTSCEKCYLCYNPAKFYEQELCGSGQKIEKSIKDAEDAGWECTEFEN